MDCIFNYFTPSPTAGKIHVIYPTGKTFITGFARSYNAPYCEQTLKGYLSEDQYFLLVEGVNTQINTFWPCLTCFLIGYLLAPLTCCLSFYCPNICIYDAKNALLRSIERDNRLKLNQKGLHLKYVQRCSTSWLELSILDK